MHLFDRTNLWKDNHSKTWYSKFDECNYNRLEFINASIECFKIKCSNTLLISPTNKFSSTPMFRPYGNFCSITHKYPVISYITISHTTLFTNCSNRGQSILYLYSLFMKLCIKWSEALMLIMLWNEKCLKGFLTKFFHAFPVKYIQEYIIPTIIYYTLEIMLVL